MKGNSKTVYFRNLVACCLMFAVFAASSMVALASPETKSATGELIVSGNNANGAPYAMINGERAFSGRTFFSSGTIATNEDNGATVKLNKLGSVNLAPNSILSLNFSDNKISGNLIAGQVKISSSEGVEVKIQTPDQTVTSDASQSNVFTVDILTGTTNAKAEVGSIHLNNGDAVIPAQSSQTTTSNDGNSYVGPLIVFGAIVAVAAVFVINHNNNDNTSSGFAVVSPTR